MKRLFVLIAAILSLLPMTVHAYPSMSAEGFLSTNRLNREGYDKSVAVRLEDDEGRSRLSTYQVDGQARDYALFEEQCTYGGYPTQRNLFAILNDPLVPILTADGPLAVLHCPYGEDIIVRVKKESYQELLLEYASPDGSAVKKNGKSFSVTLSSWPVRNSLGRAGTVFDAAYFVVTNETDDIRLTHNGIEAFVQMPWEKFLELTGWTKADLTCDVGQMVFLMIPLHWSGYFPGDTGDAYVSTLLRDLLEGIKVPDIGNRVMPVFCHGGIYEVLIPTLHPGAGGAD